MSQSYNTEQATWQKPQCRIPISSHCKMATLQIVDECQRHCSFSSVLCFKIACLCLTMRKHDITRGVCTHLSMTKHRQLWSNMIIVDRYHTQSCATLDVLWQKYKLMENCIYIYIAHLCTAVFWVATAICIHAFIN